MNVGFFLLGVSLVSKFYVLTFWNTLFSVITGRVNKKNNWDKIARVFRQVKFGSKEVWANWKEGGQGGGMSE